MASEFRPCLLGDVATLVSGSTPSTTNPAFWGGSTPWVSAKDMGEFWIDDAEDHLTDDGVKAASRLVQQGTVLILTRGMTLHKRVPICRTAKAATFNQDVKAVLPKAGLLPAFLPYLLVGNHSQLHERVDAAGHGTGRLNTDTILSLPVVVPGIDTQAAISKFGEAIDDRLRLLKHGNARLEATAQALFRNLVIDGAAADMNCSTSTTNKLSKWQSKGLDSIADYLNGLALQKFPPENDADYLPVIKIAQLRAGTSVGSDRASHRLKPEYVVDDGDVLFSWSGTLEVEFWCGGRGALNQHLFKVTSTQVPKWFYYLATKHHLPDFRKIAAHKATTMGHIQRKHLSEAQVPIPPPDLMAEAHEVIAPILDRKIMNAIQARRLSKLRDLLIPRLIAGSIRFPEAQSQVAEVVA